MARSYTVTIGSIYLTLDGLSTGKACKIQIENLGVLLQGTLGNVTVANDGKPFREIPLISPTGGGRPFRILVKNMTSTVYGNLKTALDAAAVAGSSFQVTGTGQPANFDVQAIVNDNPTYISNTGGFSGTTVRDVVISLITASFN